MEQQADTTPRLAFQFPGQGSQHVGMGKALAERFPSARRTFEEADDILGFALSRLCFEGPAETLTDTVNAQPAILTTSIAALRALAEATDGRIVPDYYIGHSLGEYSALVAAGALTFADGLRLVRLRGELMQEAGRARPGGMMAVIGLDARVLEEICRQASDDERVVQVANDNAPGQVVLSGDMHSLERAGELAKEAGARRIIRLAVSIAAHSRLMARAAEGLRRAVHAVSLQPPAAPVVANVDARPIHTPEEVRQELVAQLTAPVRWTDSIRELARRGVGHFVEIGPGSVLTGLVGRIVGTASATSVGDSDAVLAFAQVWR
ncbi:MAG: ACP S-malonyltransferase [Anaerolineales bacterium]